MQWLDHNLFIVKTGLQNLAVVYLQLELQPSLPTTNKESHAVLDVQMTQGNLMITGILEWREPPGILRKKQRPAVTDQRETVFVRKERVCSVACVISISFSSLTANQDHCGHESPQVKQLILYLKTFSIFHWWPRTRNLWTHYIYILHAHFKQVWFLKWNLSSVKWLRKSAFCKKGRDTRSWCIQLPWEINGDTRKVFFFYSEFQHSMLSKLICVLFQAYVVTPVSQPEGEGEDCYFKTTPKTQQHFSFTSLFQNMK